MQKHFVGGVGGWVGLRRKQTLISVRIRPPRHLVGSLYPFSSFFVNFADRQKFALI